MRPALQKLRVQGLDFGRDFLPWLVAQGYPVSHWPCARLGDLGTIADYLATTRDVLRGLFPSALELLGPPYDAGSRIWIPRETLEMRVGKRGATLAARLNAGALEIGPNVRLGRYVVVGDGARLGECSVGDEAEISPRATVYRSVVGEGSLIGPHARLSEAVTGLMSDIRSLGERPTVVEKRCAVGDECLLEPGVHLSGRVYIHPRLRVPAGMVLRGPCEVAGSQQLDQCASRPRRKRD